MKIVVGDFSREYRPCKTKAPKAYDCGGVIDITVTSDGTRYILVPVEAIAWQIARNESGMFGLELTDELPEYHITKILVDRMSEGE